MFLHIHQTWVHISSPNDYKIFLPRENLAWLLPLPFLNRYSLTSTCRKRSHALVMFFITFNFSLSTPVVKNCISFFISTNLVWLHQFKNGRKPIFFTSPMSNGNRTIMISSQNWISPIFYSTVWKVSLFVYLFSHNLLFH